MVSNSHHHYAKEKSRRMGCVVLPSGRHRPLPGFASNNFRDKAEAGGGERGASMHRHHIIF